MKLDTTCTGPLPTHQKLKIDRTDGNWVIGSFKGCPFEAKVFSEGSEYGINNGRVSKLRIGSHKEDFGNGPVIYNYDRGVDIDSKIGLELASIFDSALKRSNANFISQKPKLTKSGLMIYPAIINGNQHWVSIPSDEDL